MAYVISPPHDTYLMIIRWFRSYLAHVSYSVPTVSDMSWHNDRLAEHSSRRLASNLQPCKLVRLLISFQDLIILSTAFLRRSCPLRGLASNTCLYSSHQGYGVLSSPSRPIRYFDEERITLSKLFRARSQSLVWTPCTFMTPTKAGVENW